MLTDPVTVRNFRNELDETVLERGWYYFNNGWVKPPKEIMPGYFESVVEEVNPHAVAFSMDENAVVSDVFCTCGDPNHDMCRHMAAVLFWYANEMGVTGFPEVDGAEGV
jgi:hypothetical protein